DEALQSIRSSYYYIHYIPKELDALPLEELLQACLEFRSLLLAIMSELYTPSTGLTVRTTAIDLLYTQAQNQVLDHAFFPEMSEVCKLALRRGFCYTQS